MEKKLQLRYSKLEDSRSVLLKKLESIDQEKLNLQPQQDKWSIIQVANHLIEAEHKSIKYISKKLTKQDNLEATGPGAMIKSFILKLILRSPLRIKAPEVISQSPENNNFDQVEHRWNQTRKDLGHLLDCFTEESLRKSVFRHPFAGKMTICQTLDVFQEHFDHHLKQFERIKKEIY